MEFEDSQNRDPHAVTPTVVKYVRRVKADDKEKDAMNEECEDEAGQEDGECSEEAQSRG